MTIPLFLISDFRHEGVAIFDKFISDLNNFSNQPIHLQKFSFENRVQSPQKLEDTHFHRNPIIFFIFDPPY